MIISELNYLEVADKEANVVGASGGSFYVDKYIDVDKDIYVDIDKYVNSYANAYGKLAEAEALAEFYGKDGLAETLTYSSTTPYGGTAVSESTSVTDYAYYY